MSIGWKSSGDAQHTQRHYFGVKRPLMFLLGIGVGAAIFGIMFAVGATDSSSAEEVLSVLSRQPTSADALDDRATSNDIEMVSNSSRLLYETEGETHWVSVTQNGDVCLTSLHEPKNASVWQTATACMDPARFAEHGLYIHDLAAPGVTDDGIDATLIPDGVVTEEVRRIVQDAGGTIPMANLVLFPPETRPHELLVPTPTGQELNLGVSD